jgi:phage-related baseplate assembly protein
MEVAMASQQPISDIRALTADDLDVLIDVLRRRHDGR